MTSCYCSQFVSLHILQINTSEHRSSLYQVTLADECKARTRQVKDIERKMSVMTPAWEEEDRSAEEARQWEWGVFQCKERACICVQVGQLSSTAAAWDLYLFTTRCVGAARYETHTNPLKRSYLPAGSCHTHRPLCSPCTPSTDALISSLLCWAIRVKRVVRKKNIESKFVELNECESGSGTWSINQFLHVFVCAVLPSRCITHRSW